MGDALRRRVLLYLGLGKVWVELEAMQARLKRVEADVYGARTPRLPSVAPPPWTVTCDTGIRDRQVSTSPEVPFSRNRQRRGDT